MNKSLTSTLIAGITLLFAAGNAEELCQDDLIAQDEQHVIVDSRPLLPQKKLLMEHNRQSELEQVDQMSEEEAIQLGVLIIPIKSQNLYALASNQLQSTAASLSPYQYHSIKSFPQENVIKIEDGSEWMFDKADSYLLRSWEPGHTIVVSPKQQLIIGSHYAYTMTNKDIGTSVNVNLFLGPIAFGSWSTWVVGIDQNQGKVYLLNGQGERTTWEVSSSDMYLFKDWKVNDTVIIGENDSWLWCFSSYSAMIVNVNMNHNVRARQISLSNHRMVG